MDRQVAQAFTQTGRPGRSIRRKRDHSRKIVISLIVGFVLLSFFNFALVLALMGSASRISDAATLSSSSSFKSRYDDLGGQVVTAWMSGEQPMVDTVQGVEWPTDTGIDVVSVGYLGGTTMPLDGTSDYHEALKYAVVASDGSQYLASIDMGLVRTSADQPSRPVLLSAPLVQPRASVDVVSGAGVPAWAAYAIPDGSTLPTRIYEWVRAWTSNDAAALKALAGDSTSHTYSGMQGEQQWTVNDESVTLLWAAVRPSDGLVVVRIMWDAEMTVPAKGGASTLGSTVDGGQATSARRVIRQSVDVLVADAGSGLPRIVAWGAPGSYGTLTAEAATPTEGK